MKLLVKRFKETDSAARNQTHRVNQKSVSKLENMNVVSQEGTFFYLFFTIP